MTCFVSKPSRITLVVLSIINTHRGPWKRRERNGILVRGSRTEWRNHVEQRNHPSLAKRVQDLVHAGDGQLTEDADLFDFLTVDRDPDAVRLRFYGAPAEAFTNGVSCSFSFFRQIFQFCIFWDIWVLRDPTFRVKINKNKQIPFIRKQLGRGTYIKLVCKISGSISPKRRGHLGFCAVKYKNHGSAS